jgi:RND family efflux transporter MFP subunit
MKHQRGGRLGIAVMLTLLVAGPGCGNHRPTETAGASIRTMPVSVTKARVQDVEVAESTVGTLQAESVPTVAAETAGRVLKVLHDAGDTVEAGALLAVLDSERQSSDLAATRAAVQRLEALSTNQDLTVKRLQDLAKRQSVSQNVLDEGLAQQQALRAQLREAHARSDEAARALRMTEIRTPAAGVIQRRLVSVGSYVAVGDGLFELVTPSLMRALLPYPENVASRLRVGQLVRLEAPTGPGQTLEARLTELRPMVGTANRAVEAIAAFANPGDWRAGSSVTARVVTDARRNVVVATGAIVLRPAGAVVYEIEKNVARQRIVTTGLRMEGLTEITAGLRDGETVALDGAGFLTDGAAVTIREDKPASAQPRK